MTDTPKVSLARAVSGLAAAAGVGLAGFWMAKAVVIFTTPESAWVPPLPVQSVAVREASRPILDPDFDAFDRSADSEVADVAIGDGAPETTLNLTLTGLRSGVEDGAAYIRTPDREEGVFRVGDEIIPGVSLEAVAEGFAVIRRSTGLERLSLREDGGTAADRGERIVSASASGAGARDPLAAGRATGSGSGQANPLARVSAGDLLRNVSLDRVMDGSRVTGFRVTAREGTDLSQYGLRSGDIVTRINGEDLTQGRPDLGALMQELGRTNSASLVVLRDGAPVTVRIGAN